MQQPESFSWIDQPLLGAMAWPESAEELLWLRQEGIEVLLCLAEDPPPRTWVEKAGLLLYHVPMVDMEPPSRDQLDRCISAIMRAHKQKMGVTVHCAAGLGRTGVVLASFLVSKGMKPSEAIARVRKLRPGSIETEEQAEAVADFAQWKNGPEA